MKRVLSVVILGVVILMGMSFTVYAVSNKVYDPEKYHGQEIKPLIYGPEEYHGQKIRIYKLNPQEYHGQKLHDYNSNK